jgi:hypothetical protein
VYLLPSGNLKEAVNSEQADGLGISVVSKSLTKDFETTDIPKPSACSEFTASFRMPDGSKYPCTSSIVADPTPPKKTDVAIQCDIIDFQQFQKFMEMMNMFKFFF